MPDLLATLASELVAGRGRRLRAVFEEGAAKLLGFRYVRLSVGQTVGPQPLPMVRDRGVIAIPLASGLAVLEAATSTPRPLDEWEWQFLSDLAHLATLVIDVERSDASPRRGSSPGSQPCGLVGSGPALGLLRERIQRVARREVPVLIEGESGVGKELVARQIHELSARARGPFVAVNCAALVESLLEAELFGIEDRTATGVRGRPGKFEIADGGTLFLDEIGDLSPQAQAKLLRVVQDQTIERVGGHGIVRVDVRLLAASNRSLSALVEQGRFRMDLFYRLNCVEIHVPPLRSRTSDIPELVDYFLGRSAEGKRMRVTPEARDAMVAYAWPGNVRELERVIERAVTLAEQDTIGLSELPAAICSGHQVVLVPSLDGRDSLRTWGSRYARLVLEKCGGNKREACRVLGITYHTLRAYLRHAARMDRMDQVCPGPVGLEAAPDTGGGYGESPAVPVRPG